MLDFVNLEISRFQILSFPDLSLRFGSQVWVLRLLGGVYVGGVYLGSMDKVSGVVVAGIILV